MVFRRGKWLFRAKTGFCSATVTKVALSHLWVSDSVLKVCLQQIRCQNKNISNLLRIGKQLRYDELRKIVHWMSVCKSVVARMKNWWLAAESFFKLLFHISCLSYARQRNTNCPNKNNGGVTPGNVKWLKQRLLIESLAPAGIALRLKKVTAVFFRLAYLVLVYSGKSTRESTSWT